MSATKTRVIRYYDWQRHWYRVLDFVQVPWHRFSSNPVGHVLIVGFVIFAKLFVKVCYWLLVATVIIGFGVMFLSLRFALGGGGLAKAISKANKG